MLNLSCHSFAQLLLLSVMKQATPLTYVSIQVDYYHSSVGVLPVLGT